MLYWQIYFLCIVILTLFYGWVISYITQAWIGKKPEDQLNELLEAVTVVVIAKDESQNIQSCLKSILSNPVELLHQIIIVDDHSDDDTITQIEALAHPKIKILQLSNYPDLAQFGSSYKKSGLHYALDHCETQWVMTTDGDCIVRNSWIEAMLNKSEQSKSDMLTGPIVLRGDDSVMQRWQSIEMMGTMAGTMAGIESDSYHSANAANMLFQKADYLCYLEAETHNYASGDDVFFVQWMAKNGKRLGFIKDYKAIVTTEVESTLRGLYQQRLRWSTKTMAYPDIGMKLFMALIFLFHALIFINFLLAGVLMNSWLLYAGLIMLLVKAILDFRLLHRLKSFFDYPYSLTKGFFNMIFLHSLYILLIGINGLFVRNYIWKGRKVR